MAHSFGRIIPVWRCVKLVVFGSSRTRRGYANRSDRLQAIVAKILGQFGWDGADMGTVRGARAIEPPCQLW
jgi:hypothetical protein